MISGVEPKRAQFGKPMRRLVGGDRDAVSRGAQPGKTWRRIRINVVGGKAGRRSLAQRGDSVQAGTHQLERLAVMATGGDCRTERGDEARGRDTEPLGPFFPQPPFVDEDLADVKGDNADRHQAGGKCACQCRAMSARRQIHTRSLARM